MTSVTHASTLMQKYIQKSWPRFRQVMPNAFHKFRHMPAFVLGDSANLRDIKPEPHQQATEHQEEATAGQRSEAGRAGHDAIVDVSRQLVSTFVKPAPEMQTEPARAAPVARTARRRHPMRRRTLLP